MPIDERGGGGATLSNPEIAQLRHIAAQITHLAGLSLAPQAHDDDADPVDPSDAHLVALAERDLSWRLWRNKAFGAAAMFGEPTWELLLDLFVQSQRWNEVTVTSACIAAGVPTTTALRYLSALIDAGLVERKPSQADKRMHLVVLTDRGIEMVKDSLKAKFLGPDYSRRA
jgi:predicted transcriptional regulator